MKHLWPWPWKSLVSVAIYALVLAWTASHHSWQRPWPSCAAIAAGYALSIVVGGIVVHEFHKLMKLTLSGDPPTDPPRCKWLGDHSSDITGFIERAVFTTLVFASLEATLIAMGGWLTLKMAATWNRDVPIDSPNNPFNPRNDKLFWASHAFLGLQTGFVSMAFAGAGGALALWLMFKSIT